MEYDGDSRAEDQSGQEAGTADQSQKKKKQEKKRYDYRQLSAFCLQISLLLEAAVPLDEGLSIMAEDAADENEKQMLLTMSEDSELGDPFSVVLERSGAFPPYVIKMANLGQQTGTLDQMMASLSTYYEKEYYLLKNIKNAVTYPVIMIFMLLTVLFVLFAKVMPIFEGVYEQLGAQLSPMAQSAIRVGGALCGGALILGILLVLVCALTLLLTKSGRTLPLVEQVKSFVKSKSKIALAASNRRFTSVLALTLKCGLEFDKGLDLAAELADNTLVEEKLKKSKEMLEDGQGYYETLKSTGLFSGFHVQMIKTGTRSGHLDRVMEDISKDYDEEADNAIDRAVTRFEPTVVAVLAIAVGLVLLSVMLPLVGILSTIG